VRGGALEATDDVGGGGGCIDEGAAELAPFLVADVGRPAALVVADEAVGGLAAPTAEPAAVPAAERGRRLAPSICFGFGLAVGRAALAAPVAVACGASFEAAAAVAAAAEGRVPRRFGGIFYYFCLKLQRESLLHSLSGDETRKGHDGRGWLRTICLIGDIVYCVKLYESVIFILAGEMKN